jgi:myosin heavy subunit
LNTLGISSTDVTKVLAAILLLGNLQYLSRHSNSTSGTEITSDVGSAMNGMLSPEAVPIADLLGISPATLFQALCIRTHQAGGQLLQAYATAQAVSKSNLFLYEINPFFNFKLIGLNAIAAK